MKCQTWKNSKLGWIGFRLAYAGFLALCWLSSLSGQELPSPPVEAPSLPQEKQLTPDQLLNLSDIDLIMLLADQLEAWTQYSAKQQDWNNQDKAWKKNLLIWWKEMKTSLQKQEEERQQELSSLKVENEILKGQIKDLQTIPWIAGGGGFAGGFALGLWAGASIPK